MKYCSLVRLSIKIKLLTLPKLTKSVQTNRLCIAINQQSKLILLDYNYCYYIYLKNKLDLKYNYSFQGERREQHFTPGRFTPIKLPEGPPLEGVAHLLDFPRHRLRLLEKLGEGDFGMVSILIYIVL